MTPTSRSKSVAFLQLCRTLVTSALTITDEKILLGENDEIPLPDILGDRRDVLAFMTQKLNRAKSYLASLEKGTSEDPIQTVKEIEDSLLDLVNYTLFLTTMIKFYPDSQGEAE